MWSYLETLKLNIYKRRVVILSLKFIHILFKSQQKPRFLVAFIGSFSHLNSCYKQSFSFLLYLHTCRLMDTHFRLIWYRLSQWTPISLSILKVYQINSCLSIYFKIILQFHMNLYYYYYRHIFLVLIYSTYYALQIFY